MLIGRVLAALALVAVLVSGVRSAAVDDEYSRATLKGLTGVHVAVGRFSEIEKRAGFDEGLLQTDVELKLRMAGIKVLSEEEWLKAPGGPWLAVAVNSMHKKHNEVAAFSVIMQLNQDVRMKRAPSIESDSTTWSSNIIGQDRGPKVRQAVKDLTDKFINAWLSVNPKK